jgi:UDP-N-acetylmuramoylalanine--D-glutamate ligase
MDERGIGPAIALITNIAEDHLDTYPDFATYADTKRTIGKHLSARNTLVLNADDPEVSRATEISAATVFWFGVGTLPGSGVRLDGRALVSSVPGREGRIVVPTSDQYRGEHQRLNAAAATSAALLRGASLDNVREGLERFRGVPNRMELVSTINGVDYINDSAATAPAAAIASLRSLTGRRVHIIAGGADKRLPLEGLAVEISERAASIVLLGGTATPRLVELIEADGRLDVGVVETDMESAVRRAASGAESGDIVLLSPGCASFGLFRDEFDRGDQFRCAARSLSEVGVRA